MLFSTSGSYQKVNATNACFEKLREVELKDIYTIGHSRRVSSLSMSIALQLDPGYDILTLGAAATFMILVNIIHQLKFCKSRDD